MLDLLGGVPQKQGAQRRVGGVKEALAQRPFGEDGGKVLAGGGDRKTQRRRREALDAGVGDALVDAQEVIHLVALRREHLEEALVRLGVAAFLAEEAARLLVQHRIVYLIEVMANAADKKALAGREQQVDPIDQVRRQCQTAEPVSRNAGIKLRRQRARTRQQSRRRGGHC